MHVVIKNKDGNLKAVYSQRDLDFMLAKGWQIVPIVPAEPPIECIEPIEKRKPGRPRKA